MASKQSSDLIKLTIALLDFGLITLAFYLAHWFRFGTNEPLSDFIWLYYFSAPLILFLLLRHGVLTGFRYQRLREIFKSTIIAFAIAGVISSTVLYLSKAADYSRLLFGNYFVLSVLFLLFEKALIKKALDRHFRRGGMNIRIALVGFGSSFDEILDEIKARPQWGISATLILDPRRSDARSIATTIRDSVIDEVYVAYARGTEYHQQIDELLGRLEKLGLPVRVTLNFDELNEYYGQYFCTLGSKTGVMLAPYNLDPDQLILKRVMDLFIGFIGILATVIILPIIAFAIKLDTSGPIFFSQTRVGKMGREFKIYKFRSMYDDAEQDKEDLLAKNIHKGPLFKVADDPRITRTGKFIRKYSLDEFPQFWNVVKGDMSLVGTRPPTRAEVEAYEDHHFRRISIRPGITGLWQVSGRNRISEFEEVVALDVEYIKKWNVWLDLRIILRTVAVVLFPGKSDGM